MLKTIRFILSLIAVMFFHYGYFCQSAYQFYQFPKEIPKNYVVDAKQDYEKLKLVTKPTNASKEEIEGYCEFITYSKQNLFNTGGVYFNWAELENYLNTVLKNILPDSLKNNKALHVYPARKADFNAFAISDGSLFVNIGYLSEIPNEASLASTMGHEITHYLKHDTYESYFRQLEKDKTEKKAKNYEQALAKKLDKASYERSQEVIADSIGYLFAHNGGYNVENSLTDFYLLLMQEQLDEKANKTKTLVNVGSKKDTIGQSKGKLIFQLLNDHPGSKERMEMIYRFLKSNPTNEKKDFIQNKDLFLKLKQQARYEKLNILMEENNYYDCMLSSFTYYMQNPEDKIYHYYLLESLRKFIYTEENITLEKGFLNMHLRGLLKYNKGILHNIRLVSPDTAYVKSIKAFDLADTSTIEFENYYQAFDYFLNEAMKKNVTEAYLIAAQKNYDDDEIRQAYCTKYISFPDAAHKEYAEALMNKGIYKELANNNKELYLANSLNMMEEYEHVSYKRYIKASEYTSDFFKQFKKDLSKKFPKKEFLLYDSLRFSDFNRYMKIQRLIETPFVFGTKAFEKKDATQSNEVYFDDAYKPKEEKTLNDLFILETGFWEFFKQNKLKSVEYCNTTTFENKTREKLFNNRKWASYYSVGFFKFDPNGKQRFFIDSEFRQFVDFNPESYSDLLIKELKFLEKDN